MSMKNLVSLFVLVFLASCLSMVAHAREDVVQNITTSAAQKMLDIAQKKLNEHKQKIASNNTGEGEKRGVSALAPQSLIIDVVKSTLKETLNEVKEHYKEEGKQYARQLGDNLVEPIVNHHKVQSTLLMVKTIAWVLGIYLTLVTLLLMVMMHKLLETNKRVLALLEERHQQ